MTDALRTSLLPISVNDFDAVATFLHRHMNDRFSVAEWKRGLGACWLIDPPNHGFMLCVGDDIVGVLCAIYSEQTIAGQRYRICNPHTWCVLEPYRTKSVNLVLSVIRQEGYHFTMFSPNAKGEEIFAFLGFKPLDRTRKVLPHLPFLQVPGRVFVSSGDARDKLEGEALRVYLDHEPFDWLDSVIFEHEGKSGFVLYKQTRYKRLPCADIIMVSNRDLFTRCWSALRTHLLFKHGLCCSRIEQRLLGTVPGLSFSTHSASAKFYLSDVLSAQDIGYGYSELVVMDL